MAAPIVALDDRKDFGRICIGTILLCLCSGLVNALAIIELGGTVGFHTGNTSHASRSLGSDCFRFVRLLISFVTGAAAAGAADCSGEVVSGSRSGGLVAVAVLIAAGSIAQPVTGVEKDVVLGLWAASQGLQNGITTRFCSVAVRSTHMTGTLTDIGLMLGQCLSGRGSPSRKSFLLLLSWIAFAAGGAAAAGARSLWPAGNSRIALVPAALLLFWASGYMRLAGDDDEKKHS